MISVLYFQSSSVERVTDPIHCRRGQFVYVPISLYEISCQYSSRHGSVLYSLLSRKNSSQKYTGSSSCHISGLNDATSFSPEANETHKLQLFCSYISAWRIIINHSSWKRKEYGSYSEGWAGSEWSWKEKKEPRKRYTCLPVICAAEWWSLISAEKDALSWNKNQDTWPGSPQLLPLSLGPFLFLVAFKYKPNKQTGNWKHDVPRRHLSAVCVCVCVSSAMDEWTDAQSSTWWMDG